MTKTTHALKEGITSLLLKEIAKATEIEISKLSADTDLHHEIQLDSLLLLDIFLAIKAKLPTATSLTLEDFANSTTIADLANNIENQL